MRQDSVRSVRIETDENLLQYIIVSNDGDKLRIYSGHGYNSILLMGAAKIYVSSPIYRDIGLRRVHRDGR
jgi:hypothetical protein